MDELGPVSPRTYPPAPGWSSDGHRIKAPLEYSRGIEKVWVYGALRVRDGKALTLTAPPRKTKGYLRLLEAVAQANPNGDLYCEILRCLKRYVAREVYRILTAPGTLPASVSVP
jgi:hypothetical protein